MKGMYSWKHHLVACASGLAVLGWSCPALCQTPTFSFLHQYGTVDGLGGTVEDLFGLPILAGQGVVMLPMGGQAYQLCLTDENAPIVEGTDVQTTVMNSAVACLDMDVHQSFVFERFDDFFLAAYGDVFDDSLTETIAATIYATQRDASGQVIGNPFPVEIAGHMQTLGMTVDTQDFGMLFVETITLALIDSFSSISDAIAAAQWLSTLIPVPSGGTPPSKPGPKSQSTIEIVDGNQTANATQAPEGQNDKGIACLLQSNACEGQAKVTMYKLFGGCVAAALGAEVGGVINHPQSGWL